MKHVVLVMLGLCLSSCDPAGEVETVAANPYENTSAPSVAPPVPQSAPGPQRPGVPVRPVNSGKPATPHSPPTPTLKVQDAGAQAVALSFTEYSRMTRKATEMLEELTKMHIAVDESGDAEPYADRWGQRTADLTQLYLDALKTGYPPLEIARQLDEQGLPQLKSALDATHQAMREHTGVESGIDKCYADAEAIYKHMHHALDSTE